MKNSTNLTIYNLGENLAYCEAMGLSKVFEAYANIGEDIMEGGIGFNPNSGYVYIALENGISICSMLGRETEFLVTNFENGEETFFNDYGMALEYSNGINA